MIIGFPHLVISLDRYKHRNELNLFGDVEMKTKQRSILLIRRCIPTVESYFKKKKMFKEPQQKEGICRINVFVSSKNTLFLYDHSENG